MFPTKRLAKRSIIGTRVAAMWPQDGRYYPGVIRSQLSEDSITSSASYLIYFDDGFNHHIKATDIVGFGFNTITSATLKKGQKVFITLNGREVAGVVRRHEKNSEEVVVTVVPIGADSFDTSRRLEDVRLLESRKSARLVDQDTDYSKLADIQLSELNRRRASSQIIDVPSFAEKERHRRRYASDDLQFGADQSGGNFDDVEMMDETIAAMVLTSLSVSPTTPPMTSGMCLHTGQSSRDTDGSYNFHDGHLSSSVASSGFFSGHSERDDSSPPLVPLSESAPATVGYKHSTPGSDDDSSDGRLFICEEEDDSNVLYKCTWRGCNEVYNTQNEVVRHIRRGHFDRDSDIEMTDDEEDFHFTEIEPPTSSINRMTQSFAALNTFSQMEDKIKHSTPIVPAPPISHSFHGTSGYFDHDYQRKVSKHNNSATSPVKQTVTDKSIATSLPISIAEGQIKRSLSWQIPSPSPGSVVPPPSRLNRPTAQVRLYQHQAQSPKSHLLPCHSKTSRRPRSEVRKCRKVYGMEHKDQWCTQCKWKKACTRFLD